MHRLGLTAPLLAIACLSTAAPLVAAPRVEMELATEEGIPITAPQRWLRLLTQLGVDGVRIRSSRPGDEVKIITQGSERNPSYKLQGILTAREKLMLPGGTFGSRDVARLKKYLEQLRTDGAESLTEKKGAFGLSNKQLVQVAEALTEPIDFATKGLAPKKVLQTAASRLELPLIVDPTARRALATEGTVLDDVQGVSLGSGLAAVLRPFGLVLQPRRPSGGQVQLVVTKPAAGGEAWPIGWPLEEPERKVAPVMFEFLNVEIEGIVLPKVLDALNERVKMPFLIDHNSLARQRIEIEDLEVALPAGRSYYKRILDRVLFQAKLKGEVRVDEAGKPLYWITTIKQ